MDFRPRQLHRPTLQVTARIFATMTVNTDPKVLLADSMANTPLVERMLSLGEWSVAFWDVDLGRFVNKS